jgi:hypothetical protein
MSAHAAIAVTKTAAMLIPTITCFISDSFYQLVPASMPAGVNRFPQSISIGVTFSYCFKRARKNNVIIPIVIYS